MIVIVQWVLVALALVFLYVVNGVGFGMELTDGWFETNGEVNFISLIGAEALVLALMAGVNIGLRGKDSQDVFEAPMVGLIAVNFSLFAGGLHGWEYLLVYALPVLFTIYFSQRAAAFLFIIGALILEWLIHLLDFFNNSWALDETYEPMTNWEVPVFINYALGVVAVTGLGTAIKAVSESKQGNKSVGKGMAKKVQPIRRSATAGGVTGAFDKKTSVASEREMEVADQKENVGSRVVEIDPELNDQADLQGVLDSVVYFMSKNFKCTTALAFLSEDLGKTFKLNAAVSKLEYEIVHSRPLKAGQGLLGKASQLDLGLMSGNLRNYPDKLEYYEDSSHVNSAMVARIRDDDTGATIGLLVVDSIDLQAFHDEEKQLLNRFSKIAAKLISNVQMSQKMIEHNKKMELIYGISKRLSEELTPNGVLKTLIGSLKNVFTNDRIILCDYQAEFRKGRIVKVVGKTEEGLKPGLVFDLTNEHSFYSATFMSKKEMLIHDSKSYQFRFVKGDFASISSMMIAPILNDKDAVIALIGVESTSGYQYTGADLTLLKTLMVNSSSALTKAQMFRNMEKLATIDGLTQIPNHRNFQDVCDEMLAKATTESKPLSLLLMDIDHFKKFNDTYGHPVGDQVLKQVASAIKKSIRVNDFVARYGGEEFIVLLSGLDQSSAMESAERIRKGVEDLVIPHESGTLKVTVSLGCCTYPVEAMTKAELIDNADKALYTSKENGRNQATLFRKG